MSHNWTVKCKSCNVEHEHDYNHMRDELVQAVEQSHPIWLLSKTGWAVPYDLSWQSFLNQGLAQFIVDHFDHGGFQVVGEYLGDVPIDVIPEAPAEVYTSVCLARVKAEAQELIQRLSSLLGS